MFWRFVFLTLVFLLLFSATGSAAPSAQAQKQLVDRVVAVVNNEAITQSELDLYLRPLYEELRKQYEGTELSRQLAEIRLKLLKQMIEDRLVFQAAEAQKLTVDEAEIDEMVTEFKKGFPSEGDMEKAMAGEGYTLTKLRERYRRQILIRKLHDIEIRSRVVVSPLEIEEFYKKNPTKFSEKESLRVHSITLKKSDTAREKGLTDEAAKKKIEE
ncbi:MAG: SurA N-terminal domain-containing protein, partial [Candidatus Omnitrophica bacterium]|nr:SurA N-terminal domain-containing protein [Candidatus Omnitrophota bacterium]